MSKPSSITRRKFLASTTQAALIAPYILRPYRSRAAANDRLNIAAVGSGGRAAANIAGVKTENIVAIADVDAKTLGKSLETYPNAKGYRDFRVMLEKESERIDAVLVGTPDHTHAVVASMALKMGKHVYCEKPLAHTVGETRHLTDLASKKGLVTQMGTQIHAGDNYRRVVELIQGQAIGDIKEVHIWVSIGHSYSGGRFTTATTVPDHLDWDLWLGPASERPYSDGVHPFTWRSFWEYGNGRLGDFGCHYMDLAHWALRLEAPDTIRAEGPPLDDVSTPEWLKVHYEYPSANGKPPVNLHWYGNRKPKLLEQLRDPKGAPYDWKSGHLFVGSEGMILSDYSKHILLPEDKFKSYVRPERSIEKSVGHHQEWIHAIKNGGKTTCNFDYGGPLTESVLLGVAAYKTRQAIRWDRKAMKVIDNAAAQALLNKEYRKGWQL